MGFKVSVTSGLNVETLPLFEGDGVHAFIAGRAITEADTHEELQKNSKIRSKNFGVNPS